MQDSSPFRWLEERGPACHLIALIDDATSRIWARFTEHDTTEENLRTLEGWLRRYGRPLAHYTDKNSIFRRAGPAAASGTTAGRAAAFAVRTSAERTGDRMDRGAQSASQRPHRAAVRDSAGSPGERDALGGNRHHRGGESLFGDALSSGVGAAFYGGTAQPAQCPSTTGARTSPGRNLECARGPQGGTGPHGQLGGKPLGRAAGRSLCGASRSAGRDRTAAGWHATGCASAAAICACAPAQNRCARPQVLPAYGLQDLPNEYRNPKTKSNPNTMCLPITLGENHGSGHFYLAENRTFLLCVDTNCCHH